MGQLSSHVGELECSDGVRLELHRSDSGRVVIFVDGMERKDLRLVVDQEIVYELNRSIPERKLASSRFQIGQWVRIRGRCAHLVSSMRVHPEDQFKMQAVTACGLGVEDTWTLVRRGKPARCGSCFIAYEKRSEK